MAIYVDFMQIEFKGYKWCHMLADTLQELHDFAALIEVDSAYFIKTPVIRTMTSRCKCVKPRLNMAL